MKNLRLQSQRSPTDECEINLNKPSNLRTDAMLVNMGPQHPSTHGAINLLVESMVRKSVESFPKLGIFIDQLRRLEKKITTQFPYPDRVDYVAAMTANEGYAFAVERLQVVDEIPAAHII